MAIRKRVSDPYGKDAKKVQRHIREGGKRPPRPPRPMPEGDGKLLYDAYLEFPYLTVMTSSRMAELSLSLLKKHFAIYGTSVQLYPAYSQVPLFEDRVQCTGVIVFLANPHRVNSVLKLELKCIPEKWLRLTLDWIEANVYE